MLLINACKSVVSYPSIPSINYTGYTLERTLTDSTIRDSIVLVKISFTFVDGDGDLFSPDTSFRSLFVNIYKNEMDSFVRVPDSTLSAKPSFHLPYDQVMDRTGQNKTQKGKMEFNFPFLIPVPYDSVKLEFYITDLSGNKSNSAITPIVKLR